MWTALDETLRTQRLAELADQGVREVNLLGQNVNAYRGPTHDGETADLALLIRYVAAIEGIARIRLSSIESVELQGGVALAAGRVPLAVPR